MEDLQGNFWAISLWEEALVHLCKPLLGEESRPGFIVRESLAKPVTYSRKTLFSKPFKILEMKLLFPLFFSTIHYVQLFDFVVEVNFDIFEGVFVPSSSFQTRHHNV